MLEHAFVNEDNDCEMREVILFSLLRSKPTRDGITGVAFTSDNACIAHISRSRALTPHLTHCAYKKFSGIGQRSKTLAELVKEQNLTSSPTVLVLQPSDYSVLQVEAPDVEPDELKAAIRWRIKDLIDFHIDDAAIDVFDIPARNRQGHARMMYVVAARASVIQHYVDTINESELNLFAIDISELAYRNLASLYPEDVGGVVTLAIAENTAMVVLTRQSSLYLARNIDIGIEPLANTAPVNEQSLSLDNSSIFETAVLELQRSMDYYESYFSQAPVTSIVITPVHAGLQGFTDYLSENLRLPTRNLNLNEVLQSESNVSEELQQYCLPAICAALRTEQTVL